MARYDDNYAPQGMGQKDLVLAPNEFVYLQNQTNGQIKVYTGPITTTISGQDIMVVFNAHTKRFEETRDFEKARQTFTSAPEGWYVVLKNPAEDNKHPETNKGVFSPELNIGKKINVSGPCSFSLFPGQMAKVIQGHRLRTNQYLVARVYDADAAEKSSATIVNAEGKEVKTAEKYFVGQLLVIKGTDVSFYMPPTGIEVLADDNGNYVRDAITLERLEYAILLDENGEKRYAHGPAVVFPKPTETFVASSEKKGGKGGELIFRALELSPISGIYIKVVADYKDADGTIHKTGEELFITGKDQMIYYPRPEHALIQYDGKYMHHAIAIPEGEGRYVLNRLTGEIETVVGPKMYLPDPRTQVMVKRQLSEKECKLMYPNNEKVREYNREISEKAIEKKARMGNVELSTMAVNNAYSTVNALDSLAIFERNANISRGTSYTKPRTITLDTKFDGVVTVNVWDGYAICVVSKSGKREVVVGPKTRLLDYDETLQTIKTPEGESVYLKLDNNKIDASIQMLSAENSVVGISTTYTVSFDKNTEDKLKWFAIHDFPKYVADHCRNQIIRKAKDTSIQNLYYNMNEIVRNTVLGEDGICCFDNNASTITEVEMRDLSIDVKLESMFCQHQRENIQKNLELSDAEARRVVIEALAENDRKKLELDARNDEYRFELDRAETIRRVNAKLEDAEREREAEMAAKQAEKDMQPILEAINQAKLARVKASNDLEIEKQKKNAEIQAAKQKSYATTVKTIIESVGPDLVAALTSKANANLLAEATRNMSAYAIADGASVADTVNTLLRGTTLEHVLDHVVVKNEQV